MGMSVDEGNLREAMGPVAGIAVEPDAQGRLIGDCGGEILFAGRDGRDQPAIELQAIRGLTSTRENRQPRSAVVARSRCGRFRRGW